MTDWLPVLKARGVTDETRVKFLTSRVWPVISYGLENCALTRADRNLIGRTQRAMEKGVCRLRPVPGNTAEEKARALNRRISAVRNRIGQETWEMRALAQKVRHAGAVVQGRRGPWACRAVEWKGEEWRRQARRRGERQQAHRGRPTRWEETMEAAWCVWKRGHPDARASWRDAARSVNALEWPELARRLAALG